MDSILCSEWVEKTCVFSLKLKMELLWDAGLFCLNYYLDYIEIINWLNLDDGILV